MTQEKPERMLSGGHETMRARPLLTAALVTGVLCALATGCDYGPFDSQRLNALRERGAYVDLAKARTTHDELFFFEELRASLIVDILNLSPDLLSAAMVRWASDQTFSDSLAKWLPGGKGRVVFVGIYARDFKVSEFSERGSYRVRLKSGGRLYEPDYVAEVKEPLLSNYLPVFNHWEKVFACHFPAPPGEEGSTLVLDFPSGTRELALVGDQGPGGARP
jgi:hypothetical protein